MKELLQSRKFWAAVIGLILIGITAVLPGFPGIEQQLTDVAVLVCAYILGTAAEGKRVPAGEALSGLIRSRKFWAAMAGVVVIVLRAAVPAFPLDDEQLTAVILTLSAYIFGTGAQDGLANLRSLWNGSSHEQQTL